MVAKTTPEDKPHLTRERVFRPRAGFQLPTKKNAEAPAPKKSRRGKKAWKP
jgi:hypothetical protein